MNEESATKDGQTPPAPGDCPLPASAQSRNLLVFAANWSLIYLASPVTYVGVMQAALVNELQFSDADANLPAAVYLWTNPLAVLVLCSFPQVRMIKPLLVGAFASAAVMGTLVAAALFTAHPSLLFWALIAYATVWGCGNGIIASCQWELVGRGLAPARRGKALALAFGVGPVFAVIASMLSLSLLGGADAGWSVPFVKPLPFPTNFAVMYVASVVVMLMSAGFSCLSVLPTPAHEPPPPPLAVSVFGGLGDFLGTRLLLLGTLAYVLVYSGHEILQNQSLYAGLVLGRKPADFAGMNLTLRFFFKIFAGFALAWLLMRTSPRALLVATAGLTLFGVLWALALPVDVLQSSYVLLGTIDLPPIYLWSFGILGAGELFGVYYLNYIERSSRPDHIRRNIAFASMATMLVGIAPVFYGHISDMYEDKAAGYRMSLTVAVFVLFLTIALVLVMLPAHPRADTDTKKGTP